MGDETLLELERIIIPADSIAPTEQAEKQHLTSKLKNATQSNNKPLCSLIWSFTPCCMIAISTIQIFIFLLGNSSIKRVLRWDPKYRGQVWRALTYIFLHQDSTHLSLNVILQLLVVSPLVHEQDGLRTTSVYLIGGISGALGATLLHPRPLVGASAGVYALLISHLSHLYMNMSTLQYRSYRVFCVLVLTASDAILYALHSGKTTINISAHGAGGVAGALVPFVVYRSNLQRRIKISAGVVTTLIFLCTTVAAAIIPTDDT